MKTFDGKSRLEQLLALRGEEFVRAAYKSILGRDADDEGLSHYLKRQSMGDSPASLLFSFADSPEGRTFLAQPLVQSPEQAVGLLEGTSDRDFVEGLYRRLLGRDADPAGLANYLQLLNAGKERHFIASDLFQSEEGKDWRARTAQFREDLAELVAFEKGARGVGGFWRRNERTQRRLGQLEAKFETALNKLTRRVDAVLHPPKPAGLPGMDRDEDDDEPEVLIDPAVAYKRQIEKPVPLSPEADRVLRRLAAARRARHAGER